jgi:predicted Ser/Thr protein kinase
MIESIGKYRVLELVGRGRVSAVYKAIDPLLKRVVAIKVIADTPAVTDEVRARFFREARAAAKLSHRNIVTVYDLGEDQKQAFLVMEYLEGEELKRIIAKGQDLSVEAKVALMIQVSDALAYAHGEGVVHRDIKPANVFVLRDGTVKILDFAVARITAASDGLTQTVHVTGTLGYMSPEQVRGRTDPRSDMFSTGLVFYELLTSHSPLLRTDPLSILDELSSTASPSLFRPDPAIPEDLAAIIERMLRKDPDARYAGMADVRGALDEVRGRLRDEARELRGGLESLATELSELEAALRQGEGLDLLPPMPALPGEGAPVAALEQLRREYEERIARVRLLRERASAVRLEYAQAMTRLDAGEWAAALAGFERVIAEAPEHVGAREGLARARAEMIRTDEEAARQAREHVESAGDATEDATNRAPAPDAADMTQVFPRTAPAERSHDVTGSQFATETAHDAEITEGAPHRERPGQAGEESVAPALDESALEALTSTADAAVVVPEPAPPPGTPGSAAVTEAVPDVAAPEPAAARGVEASDSGASSRPSTATDRDGSGGDSTGQRSGVGSGEVATPAAPRAPSWMRLTGRPARTLALGSLALALVLAVAWLASSLATSRRLQAEVAEARQRADVSRDEAVKVEAPLLARALFDAGAAKEREGQQLAGARRFGPAVAPFREAAARYADAAQAARAARQVRDRADHARAEMLAAKRTAAPGTTEFRDAVAREQEGDDRYRQLAFAEAAAGFEAAARLFAKAVPPPVTPPPPPPPPAVDPKEEIRELLRQYARAFETKDLALLRQVRPDLRPDELTRYRATFDQVRSYRLTLTADTVTVRGAEAEAKGRREDIIVTASGKTLRYPGVFRFRFKHVNDRWTIAAVK